MYFITTVIFSLFVADAFSLSLVKQTNPCNEALDNISSANLEGTWYLHKTHDAKLFHENKCIKEVLTSHGPSNIDIDIDLVNTATTKNEKRHWPTSIGTSEFVIQTKPEQKVPLQLLKTSKDHYIIMASCKNNELETIFILTKDKTPVDTTAIDEDIAKYNKAGLPVRVIEHDC